MRFFLFIFLLSTLFFGASAQELPPQIDSLRQAFTQQKTDSIRLSAAFQLVGQTRGSYTYLALQYADSAKAIALRLENFPAVTQALSGKAMTHMQAGELEKGYAAGLAGIQLADSIGCLTCRSTALKILAKIEELQQNFTRSLAYVREALAIDRQLGSPETQAFALSTLANAHFYLQNFDSALFYQEESLRLRDSLGSPNLAFSYNDVAAVYNAQGNIQKALSYYEKANELLSQGADAWVRSIALNNLGSTHRQLGNNQKALEYFNQALKISQEANSKGTLSTTYAQLAITYDSVGNYEKAYRALQQYNFWRDSVYNEEKTKELAQLQTNFEVAQRDKQNELLRKESALQESQIERQYLLIFAALVAMGLMTALAFLQYRSRKKQKLANQALSQKNEEIKQQKEEITMIADNLTSANAEISKKNQDITSSLNYAKRIQEAFLPNPADLRQHVPESFVFFKPRDIVSGDFYFFTEQDNLLFFGAIDCTGHGVPGAFMSIIGNDLLAEIVLRHGKTEPGEILSALNIEVRRVLRQGETQNRDGMDVAFCAWNPETKQLKFAGAKNPLWMVVKSQEPELIKGSRYPIGGAQSEDATFPTHVREISEPTWVYLYSDGFQDQFGGSKGKKFMSKRFRKLLAEGSALSAEAQQTRLEETLSVWLREGREEQVDDILVMGLQLSS